MSATAKTPKALEYGDWVEVYATPAYGYYLKSLKLNGNSVTFSGNLQLPDHRGHHHHRGVLRLALCRDLLLLLERHGRDL